jgi:toxin ParE1/3/4
MPRLLKRPEAENDLDEIWWTIAQDTPNNADKFLDRIQTSCLRLADFPQMGTSRNQLKLGVQVFNSCILENLTKSRLTGISTIMRRL